MAMLPAAVIAVWLDPGYVYGVDHFRLGEAVMLRNAVSGGVQISVPMHTLFLAGTTFDGTAAYRAYSTLLWRDGWVSWWSRLDGIVQDDPDYFFPDFSASSDEIDALLDEMGAGTDTAYASEEIWEKAATVWRWLADNTDSGTCSGESGWPSIEEIADYYNDYGAVAWGSCMSKAQLYATLLGRVGVPVDRLAVAEAHYSETATHCYVVILLSDGWCYLDPTYVYSTTLPDYLDRVSVGYHATADYTHPYEVVILPGSGLDGVPLVGMD